VLGAAESTEALASAAVKLMTRMANPFHQPSPIELRRNVAAAADAARHPLELGRAVLDWDTWSSNPVRALGHLVPDALAAGASGGSAAGVRATTMAGRTGAALRTAAARDELRREATSAAATAARQALIRRAEKAAQERLAAGGSALSATWQGEGGARLSALQNAGVEAYHSLSTAAERSLTATMQDVSRLGRGELTGLDHRVKRPESAKRKVAGEHARTGRPLAALLARSEDAVRYSVVIKDADYVRGLTEITAALERHGFHAGDVHNAWHGPRYRGVNSVWLDPRSGTAFEVQFHTPASYRITVSTHELYEEFRLPSISPERKAELHELIAAEYRRAPIPGWVEVLQGKNFPPPSRPDPVPRLPDHSSAAALSGAGVVHLTVTGSQRPAHSRTP
jgi:hypothetical protein